RVAGGAAEVVGLDVVAVADLRVAPGGATGGVPPSDHPSESGGEGTGLRLHPGELVGARAAVQPSIEGGDHLVGVLLLVLVRAQMAGRVAQQSVLHDVGR